MKFSKEQLLGIVRHSLTFIGGIFITKGLIDESLLKGMSELKPILIIKTPF